MASSWGWSRRVAMACLFWACLPISAAAQSLIYVAGETTGPASVKAAHLTVINPGTGRVIKSLSLGQWTVPSGAPASSPSVVAMPDGSRVFVTVGPDLAIVDAANYNVQRVTLGGTLGELALSADGSRLYVAGDAPQALFVVDTATGVAIGAPMSLPERPRRLALTVDGTRLYVLGADNVYVVEMATRAIVATVGTRPSSVEILVHPDGTRLYVGSSTGTVDSPDGNSVTAYDTSTFTAIQTLILPDFRLFIGARIGAIGTMAILPSGSRLYVPLTSSGFRTLPPAFVRRELVHVVDAATLQIIATVAPIQSAPTSTSGIAAVAAADGTRVFVGASEGVSAINAATNAVSAAGPGVTDGDSMAVAAAPPCWFEVGPQQSSVRGGGGSVTLHVPAPAGCAWSAAVSGDWLLPSATSGTGPSTITLQVAASETPRFATVTIGAQTVRIDQVISRVVIDTPTNGAEITLPFDISGWTIEQDAKVPPGADSGVDRAHMYDYPPTGPPIFLGINATNLERADVAAAFGARFLRSGFARRIGRLSPGAHTLVVYSRSSTDGQFTGAAVDVVVKRQPQIYLDAPGNGATVSQPFRLSGWAADMTVPSGSGVDRVRVYALRPDGTRIDFGDAASGLNRPDVAAYFDQGPLTPGFDMNVSGLPPGIYTVVAEARYTATGQFERSAAVQVTIAGTVPFGFVDTPSAGASVAGAVTVTGWALSEAGVVRVAVYRDPAGAEIRPVWIGDASFVEGARPDVATAYPTLPGNTRAGWGLSVLTNLLPNAGNGPITFHTYALDANGNSTLLGSRTVMGVNQASVLPFGTLDTPGQGEPVAGTITVFGWVLTPGPNVIATDGSTIDVLVDGIVVGHPTYNQCRGTNGTNLPAPGACNDDIATAFGLRYRNIAEGSGAIGSFELDTMTLTNGIHTLEWRVTDSAGNVQGIGSRYFYVQNGG